jgi:hypothetical protein
VAAVEQPVGEGERSGDIHLDEEQPHHASGGVVLLAAG